VRPSLFEREDYESEDLSDVDGFNRGTLMNYVLIGVGALLAFISYRWSLYYRCNPNYYRLLGRSETTQLTLETISNILFFGGYILILLSSGFRIARIGINFGIILLLQIFIFPTVGWLSLCRKRRSPAEETTDEQK
jgi:hypothetical protein